MSRRTKVILLTGLFVGTTDIIAAMISGYLSNGKFPEKLLNYIAGGLVGLERAMSDPAWGWLGLFNHYAIAMTFTIIFFLVFPKVKFLHFNRYLIGMLYGIFASCVMSFIVLPLTPLPPQDFVPIRAFISWMILGVALGIPVAYNAYRYYEVDDRLFNK